MKSCGLGTCEVFHCQAILHKPVSAICKWAHPNITAVSAVVKKDTSSTTTTAEEQTALPAQPERGTDGWGLLCNTLDRQLLIKLVHWAHVGGATSKDVHVAQTYSFVVGSHACRAHQSLCCCSFIIHRQSGGPKGSPLVARNQSRSHLLANCSTCAFHTSISHSHAATALAHRNNATARAEHS